MMEDIRNRILKQMIDRLFMNFGLAIHENGWEEITEYEIVVLMKVGRGEQYSTLDTLQVKDGHTLASAYMRCFEIALEISGIKRKV